MVGGQRPSQCGRYWEWHAWAVCVCTCVGACTYVYVCGGRCVYADLRIYMCGLEYIHVWATVYTVRMPLFVCVCVCYRGVCVSVRVRTIERVFLSVHTYAFETVYFSKLVCLSV